MMKLFYQIIGLIIIALIFTTVFIHPVWAEPEGEEFSETIKDIEIGRSYNVTEIKGEEILGIENRDEKTMHVKAEPATPLMSEEKENSKLPLGLSARPGVFCFSKIPVGKKYELPLPLRIKNKSDKDRTYFLFTYKQSEDSNIKQVEGYADMLDPNWFFFERDEVTVEASGISEVKMYSQIPNNDRYYNQHWVVGLGVKGMPGEGEAVALAVYPRYFLETESKDDLAVKPYGLTGIKPSVVTLKDVPLKKIERMAQIQIFNNDYISRQYQIASVISPKDQERGIFVSPAYSWMPDPNWVIPEQKELSIDGSQSETIAVGLNIPQEDRNRGKRWESLLMVRPDQGQPRFVRIKITTKK